MVSPFGDEEVIDEEASVSPFGDTEVIEEQPIEQPVRQPQAIQPTREELLIQNYLSGKLNGKSLEAAEELIRRGVVKMPVKDEPGILDYLVGLGEVGATMATGVIAKPVSGFIGAGVEAGLIPGVHGGGEVGKIEKELTFEPKTEAGKQIATRIGEGIESAIGDPIRWTKGAVQGISDVVAEKAGPFAGAMTKGLISIIPDLMSLKGTKLAKKKALGNVLKDKDISSLYDEVGNLIPEIKKSIDDAGVDIDELKNIIPENIVDRDLGKTATEISKAAKSVINPEKKARAIVEEVKPSAEILGAAKELGVSDRLLASHASQNPVFVAIEQGLKEIPGSKLNTQEKALISDLATKADDLIVEFGGTTDKSNLSDMFRSKSKAVIDDLTTSADHAYTVVGDIIPKKTPVESASITNLLFKRAEELGGFKYLDPAEKRLLRDLDPKNNPTYGLLDKYRKQIGSGFKKNKGAFKDSNEGDLKQLYKALAEDQKKAAYEIGDSTGKLYEMANDLIVTRKTIEDQLTKTIGKELSGSITDKARSAMLGLQKGSTKQFDELVANIPEQLGADFRKSVIVTALNDAFVQGSRAERSLNIAGFDDFMVGINRNVSAKNRLRKEIGKDAVKRLDTLHLVVGGVRKAQKDAISTGKLGTVPGLFDEVDNIASRVYGEAKKKAGMIPGSKIVGAVGDTIGASKTARSEAADALLTSNRFRKILNEHASGRLTAKNKLEEAEKVIEKLKEYQAWKDTLNEKDLKDLAAVGAVGYLTGKTLEDKNE